MGISSLIDSATLDVIRRLIANPDEFFEAPMLHGNGFVRLDLKPRTKDEARIDIWHVDLPQAQLVSTPIHDHRFSFVSQILAGYLINVRYHIVPGNSYKVYQVYPREGEDTQLIPVREGVSVIYDGCDVLCAGDTYVMKALEFHESRYYGFAVTLLTKTEVTDHVPRVLVPAYGEPDNIFSRYNFDKKRVERIVNDIRSRLDSLYLSSKI